MDLADLLLGEIRLAMRGRHNLRNALAAVAVGLELGVPFPRIAAGVARPSAHGQAMIKTATALRSAMARSASARSQPAKVAAPMASTAAPPLLRERPR